LTAYVVASEACDPAAARGRVVGESGRALRWFGPEATVPQEPTPIDVPEPPIEPPEPPDVPTPEPELAVTH